MWASFKQVPPKVKFVYVMWFLILCDPQWWLASMGPNFILKLPTLMFGVMLIVVAFHPPKDWFTAFLAFIVYTIAIIPFSFNRGRSMNVAKVLIGYYVLAIGSLALLRTVQQAVPIIAGQMMYSYVWWIVWGIAGGRVGWHYALANNDGYGPLMVCGIGSCYYFGAATKDKKERRIAYAAAAACLVGVVSAFARGAVLAAGLVFVWIWVRSKRKFATSIAAVAGFIVFMLATQFISGASRGGTLETSFWGEMATITDKGGTRGDREVLWGLAVRVWKDRPWIGVGADNFGPYAAFRFRPGEVGGGYDANPATLYERALHSNYYQLLCEYGTIGCVIYALMLLDFFRLNRKLRKREFALAWRERSGGRLDLVQLSLGLEAAMIGYLGSGYFYNLLFSVHWFYTLVIINSLLYYHARPGRQPRQAARALVPSRA